jgi:hypothetical protein
VEVAPGGTENHEASASCACGHQGAATRGHLAATPITEIAMAALHTGLLELARCIEGYGH